MEEVFVEVDVPEGTRGRDVQCSLQSRHLALTVAGKEVLKGKLFDSTIADEATWTLEDQKLIRIVLTKTSRDAGNCWRSLLEDEYAADPWVQDQMQRKLTLERFQREWEKAYNQDFKAQEKKSENEEEDEKLWKSSKILWNPGFDFSGAEISGNYSKGGPDFSNLER
ncbi:UNVERIFIED_CONTAM: NudC domain-containing protein 2 [Gekko kuhli]